jgi:signal transduction histidine kinase
VLIAGAGPYHNISKIARRKLDYYDISPSAYAFRERKMVIVNDAESNPAHQQMCKHWEQVNPTLHKEMKKIGSYVNLPFRTESGEQGTIDLIAPQPWFFTRYRIKAIQAFGERVAFLLVSLKRKSLEALICDAAPQLSRAANLDQPDRMLDEALKRFAGATEAEFGSLFLWDEALQKHILRAHFGWRDSRWVHAARYDKGAQWAGMISSSGMPDHIYDLASYYRDRGWRESGGSYNQQIFGQELSSKFTVETIVLPLQLFGEALGVAILYRSINPGNLSGFSSTDTKSLREASEKLSALIGLLHHRLTDIRKMSESKRRNAFYKALNAKSAEEKFETEICSQLVRSYRACKVDFYYYEAKAASKLTWDTGAYLDVASNAVRSSMPTSADTWIEDAVRDHDRELADDKPLKVQCERRQASEAERKDPALAASEGIITRICLPLISEGRLVGALDVRWPDNHCVYSLDYDLDADEMRPLGQLISSAYRRHQINQEKQSAENRVGYAEKISQQAAIDQRKAEETKQAANQKEQETIQSVTAYMMQNAHALGNHAKDLRGFPRKFSRIEALDEYDRMVERMDVVIRRILDTSYRILERGGRIANPIFERCCLKDILRVCLEQTANPFSDQNRIVMHDENISARVFIHADRDLMQGVFSNIVKNALNAVKDIKRPAEVKIQVLEISDERVVRIIIEDNGVGMSEEMIRDIHGGQFSRNGRSGWGIRISKFILRSHNGRLEHKSRINQGTKAIITLPLAPME